MQQVKTKQISAIDQQVKAMLNTEPAFNDPVLEIGQR